MADYIVEVPQSWKKVDVSSLKGLVLIIGGPDTGKSYFARWLYQQSIKAGKRTAFLDGDPGQCTIGPPTTLSMGIGEPGKEAFPPEGKIWRRFIGSTTPMRHMLPLIGAAARLVRQARLLKAELIIEDTTGLIDQKIGGLNLKIALIDLLQPTTVFTFTKEDEMRPLSDFLQRTRRTAFIPLTPAVITDPRKLEERRVHRRKMYEQYFNGSVESEIDLKGLAVFPEPRFEMHQLIAIEDVNGFMLTLAIINGVDRRRKKLKIIAPDSFAELRKKIDAIRLGSLTLDPVTMEERTI